MSKLRTNQIETLDGLNIKDVATLVDDINAAEITTSTGTQPLPDALDDRVVRQKSDITLNIPTDYSTIQSALDYLSSRYRADQGIKATVNIEAGHALTAGFRVQNCDASWIRLTSQDATVLLDAAFTKVGNTDLSSDVPRSASIGFLIVNAKSPIWDMVVDASPVALGTGLEADYGSTLVVLPGKGVTNTANGPNPGTNCRVTTSSRIQGAQSVFTGASGSNMAVTLGCHGNLQSAVLSGAGVTGLDVSRGSYIHAKDVNVSGAGAEGIYSRRSIVTAQGADFSDCSVGVFASQGSRVSCLNAIFDGCNSNGQYNDGSYLDISGATKDGVKVVPSDFISSNDSGGTGTAAIKKFNTLSGGGIATNKEYPKSHSEYLTSGDALTSIDGDLIVIPAGSYQTIVDIPSGGARVWSGSIYGADSGIRVTIDGVVVLNDVSRARGYDSASDGMAIINLPPMFALDTLKIEIYNRSLVSGSFGYKIYTS